jgi:predicted transcriptional regulator
MAGYKAYRIDGNTNIWYAGYVATCGEIMVKTTINLEDELWKQFSVKVIQDFGGRKKTDIFQALAEAFVNAPKKTIEEAVRDWIAEEKKRQAKLKKS